MKEAAGHLGGGLGKAGSTWLRDMLCSTNCLLVRNVVYKETERRAATIEEGFEAECQSEEIEFLEVWPVVEMESVTVHYVFAVGNYQ